MPFCSREVLQAWLDEFAADGPEGSRAYVAEQESTDGRDSGLVIFPLTVSSASVYIQPPFPDSLDWCVTIEAHPLDTTLPAQRLRQLCRELSAAAILCDYLQGKAFALHASGGSVDQG